MKIAIVRARICGSDPKRATSFVICVVSFTARTPPSPARSGFALDLGRAATRPDLRVRLVDAHTAVVRSIAVPPCRSTWEGCAPERKGQQRRRCHEHTAPRRFGERHHRSFPEGPKGIRAKTVRQLSASQGLVTVRGRRGSGYWAVALRCRVKGLSAGTASEELPVDSTSRARTGRLGAKSPADGGETTRCSRSGAGGRRWQRLARVITSHRGQGGACHLVPNSRQCPVQTKSIAPASRSWVGRRASSVGT